MASSSKAAASDAKREDNAETRGRSFVESQLDEIDRIQNYVFTHKKSEKKGMIEKCVQSVLSETKRMMLDTAETGRSSRAFVAYAEGRAKNGKEGYDPDTERTLSRAVKLDASNVKAWNALANCFWKKGDLAQAKKCFQGAIDRAKDKISMRELSMLLRDPKLVRAEVPSSPSKNSKADTRLENIEASLALAKRAVALDVKDGRSWYYLGNAFLARFFSSSHAKDDVTRALKAYASADSNGEGSRNPDLHYNRANVLKFTERFDEAATNYRKAASIDPSLPADSALREMRRRFSKVASIMSKGTRALLKSKRLDAMLRDIPDEALVAHPLRKGTFCDVTRLSECADGRNEGKAVHVKCLLVARSGEEPPATLIVCDSEKTTIAVSVYNLALKAVSDASNASFLTLIEPELSYVTFAGESYRAVQIADPRLLLVQGKRVPESRTPQAVLKTETFEA